MHGKIEGGSLVDVTAGSIEFDGDIADRSTVLLTATEGGIHIRENIEGGSHVVLRAAGPIVIDGKVDRHDPRMNAALTQLSMMAGAIVLFVISASDFAFKRVLLKAGRPVARCQ